MIRGCISSRRGSLRKTLAALAAVIALTSASAGQERFRKSPPLPDPLQEIEPPEFESYRLTNGLVVSVAPMSGSPLLLIQLVVGAGLRDSPEDLPALASFTARMIGRGTAFLSSDDIETRIEALGGELRISVLMDYTVFGLRVLRNELEPALALLGAMILEPALREREIETLKRVMFYEMRSQSAKPEVAGHRLLLRLLFKDHPYSRAGYNEDVIKFITQKTVADFARKFYRSDNACVVISGDIDMDTAAQMVSRYLNTWTPRGEPGTVTVPPVEPNEKEMVGFVDFPGIEDALVLVGNLTPTLTGQEYHSFLVLNHILGGSTNSRLFMNLRESKGYAFNASSGFEFYKLRGVYWAQARLTPAALTAGIREMRAELRSLATARIIPPEIEEAKAFLIGHLPLRFESPLSFAELVSRQIGLGLGDGHWRGLSENLIRVNAEKVMEIAAQVFTPHPLVLVLGRKELLLEGLIEAFDSVGIYDDKGNLVQTIHQGEIK